MPLKTITLGDVKKVIEESEARLEKRLLRAMSEVVEEILKEAVTKAEFEERMDRMVTKAEFEERMDRMVTKAEFEERMDKVERKMTTKSDISDMVGELQSVRQQLVIVLHQYKRTQEQVRRIEKHLELPALAL